MPFNIDYTPMGAVGTSAYLGGLGRYNLLQQQNAMRIAQQQANFQQQLYLHGVQQADSLQRMAIQDQFNRQHEARQAQAMREVEQLQQQGLNERNAAELLMRQQQAVADRQSREEIEANRHMDSGNALLKVHQDQEAKGWTYSDPNALAAWQAEYDKLQNRDDLTPLVKSRQSYNMIVRRPVANVPPKPNFEQMLDQRLVWKRSDPNDPNSPMMAFKVSVQPSGDPEYELLDPDKVQAWKTGGKSSAHAAGGKGSIARPEWRKFLTDPKNNPPGSPIDTADKALELIRQNHDADAALTDEAWHYFEGRKPATGESLEPPTPAEITARKKEIIAETFGLKSATADADVIKKLGGFDNLPKRPLIASEHVGNFVKGQTYTNGTGQVVVYDGEKMHPVGWVGDGNFNPPPKQSWAGWAWDTAKSTPGAVYHGVTGATNYVGSGIGEFAYGMYDASPVSNPQYDYSMAGQQGQWLGAGINWFNPMSYVPRSAGTGGGF